jgi:hypothetical protein
VTLNGAPVDYFRVNHAFRGVSSNLPQATPIPDLTGAELRA